MFYLLYKHQWSIKPFHLGPVHTYPEIFVSANLFMRIQLASTRVRPIRSRFLYTLSRVEISVCAVYPDTCGRSYPYIFCIRWRHSIRTSLFAHALLTNPLRCPDTNRIHVDGRIRFVYATCGRRYFCIRIKKFADTKISGYVWTGPNRFFGVKGATYYVAIAKVIFSHVKITCYFHLWRYQVFAPKLTWYFIGVYIINYNIFPVRNLPRYTEWLKAFHPLVNMECYLLRQFQEMM